MLTANSSFFSWYRCKLEQIRKFINISRLKFMSRVYKTTPMLDVTAAVRQKVPWTTRVCFHDMVKHTKSEASTMTKTSLIVCLILKITSR